MTYKAAEPPAPFPFSLPLTAFVQTATRWLLPLALGVLWYLASRNHWMSEQILPAPSAVWATLLEFAQGELWPHVFISLQRLLLGLLGGLTLGVALGIWMGSSSRVERIVFPTFSALAQIPTLAWIPLFMLLFGIDELFKLVVLTKAVVVPITIHVFSGVRDAQPRLREVAAVLRLPLRQRIVRLLLPAALPAFMAGLRQAIASGWTALLAVELLASSAGIGYLMVWGRQLFMMDIVFVCIAVIGILAIVLDRLMDSLERRVVFWPHNATSAFQRSVTTFNGQGAWLPLALLALWQAVSMAGLVNSAILVSPWQVLQTLVAGIADLSLVQTMATSLARAVGGLLIGSSLGLAVGLLVGLLPWCARLLGAPLSVFRQVAIFAWIPLLTAWFGIGEGGKLVFIALATFFPLFISTWNGVAQRSRQLEEVARVLHLSTWQRLSRLILPGAASTIFAGLRLALIFAWLGTIGAEYFMPSNGGIGSLMVGAQQIFRMDLIMAAMLLIGITGATLNAIGNWLETRATRWRTS